MHERRPPRWRTWAGRAFTLAAAAALVGTLAIFMISARGDVSLSFGRLEFTARNGVLISRWYHDADVPWLRPDTDFRAYTRAGIRWWSFGAGRSHTGFRPVYEISYLIFPLWVFFPLPAAWLALSARAWLRSRRRTRRGQCLRCGYDLAGLPVGAACPECQHI